jgi:hypothetical protein
MRRLEQSGVTGRPIPVHPGLAGDLQLRGGGAYAVDGVTLALTLLAGPSAAGEWGAVVGVPEFGVEAAAELGVVLERTVLVPDPGEHWLEATAALVDVAGLVVVRPPARVTERTAEKVAARLRTRGAALVAVCDQGGEWPRTELRLGISGPRWSGPGRGEGHLVSRRLSVEISRGSAPSRSVGLWHPAADGTYAAAQPSAHLAPVASTVTGAVTGAEDWEWAEEVG